MAHAKVDAVERVVGSDVECAHERVDDRSDGVEAAASRAENRFPSTMLSTSRLTASYAETFDDAIERELRPERADSA